MNLGATVNYTATVTATVGFYKLLARLVAALLVLLMLVHSLMSFYAFLCTVFGFKPVG